MGANYQLSLFLMYFPEIDKHGRRLIGAIYEGPPIYKASPPPPTFPERVYDPPAPPSKECIWFIGMVMGLLLTGYLITVLALTGTAMRNRVYYQLTGEYCDRSSYRFISIQLNYYDGLCLMPNNMYSYTYNSSSTCYGWSDTAFWQNVSTVVGDSSITTDVSYADNQRPLSALAVFFAVIPVFSLALILSSRSLCKEASECLVRPCVLVSYAAYVGILIIYSLWASHVWATLTHNHIWAQYYDCERVTGQGKESLILAIACMTGVACALGLCGCVTFSEKIF